MALSLQPVGHGLLLFSAYLRHRSQPGVVYQSCERLLKTASPYALQPRDFGHDFRHRPPLVRECHLLVGNGDGPAQVAYS
jgi:hypothetical protein